MEVIDNIVITHKRPDTFNIYPLGDIHAGSIHCAEGDIQDIVTKIKNERNSYWIGMGDYADCIIKNDNRFDIGGLATWVDKGNIIESQRKWLKELLKPISGKCLGMLTGNHEEMIHLRDSNDFTRNLCGDLGVRYGGYACYIVVKFKRGNPPSVRDYVIHAWHGSGAAQSEGARLMRLTRLVNEIQAHIYLMGHLHATTQHTPDRLMYSRGKIKSVKLAATITGSWLRAYTQPKPNQEINPSYAEMKGYKPSRIGCPIIHINPDKDKFSIES